MKYFRQFVNFIGISGIGWLIDFSIYMCLTVVFHFNVFLSNIISAIPAVTLVFLLSTRKIFVAKLGGMPVWGKYIIYVTYQMILLFTVSKIGQVLYDAVFQIVKITSYIGGLKLVIKICITPITMIMNFIVMKILTERI